MYAFSVKSYPILGKVLTDRRVRSAALSYSGGLDN